MKEYPKIQTVYKRDPATKFKTLLDGEFSLPEFEYLKDNEWVFTEKVDGTNIRVEFDGKTITFGGRTERASIPAPLVARLNALFLHQLDLFCREFPDGVTLYGEGYGAKIQKGGGNYCAHQDFVLFDVKVGAWWLQREDVESVANLLGIRVVPIIGRGNLNCMVRLAKYGFPSEWGDFPAEGIVARPATELQTRGGERIITKIKCKDFAKEQGHEKQ
jgi:hypothetical protein